MSRISWAGRDPGEPSRPTLKCVAPAGIRPCPQSSLHPGRGEGSCSSLVSSGSGRTALHSLSACYWKEEAQEWQCPLLKKKHPENQKKGHFLTNAFLFFPVPIILPRNQGVPSAFKPWQVSRHSPGAVQGFQALLCPALPCPEISAPLHWLSQRTENCWDSVTGA